MDTGRACRKQDEGIRGRIATTFAAIAITLLLAACGGGGSGSGGAGGGPTPMPTGGACSSTSTSTSGLGVSWRCVSAGTTNSYTGVAYGNGRWVSVSTTGSATTFPLLSSSTSSDGFTWATTTSTQQPTGGAFGGGASIVYGTPVVFGAGLFVALSQLAPLTSTDGVNWSLASLSGTTTGSNPYHAFIGVAYGNGHWIAIENLFSSVGISTGAVGVWTSSTGYSWTPQVINLPVQPNAVV